MKKKVYFILPIVLILVLILAGISVFLIQKHNARQTIQGVNAFPQKGVAHHFIVRVGVNPGPLMKKKESLTKVMDKITVIACAGGDCQFMHSGNGLGFYEHSFRLEKITHGKIPEILVVACSHLGCVKKTIKHVTVFSNPSTGQHK